MMKEIISKAKEVSRKLERNGFTSEFNKENLDKLILSVYHNDEVGNKNSHGTGHIYDVVEQSLNIMKKNNISKDLLNTVLLSAVLHDCTRDVDKEKHESSAEIFIKELGKINKTFNQFMINSKTNYKLVLNAIREHRASYKGEFSSIVSEIISSADRGNPESLDYKIERSFNYAKEHGKNSKEAWIHAIDHMKEKFGRNGYQKLPKLYIDFYKDEIEELWNKIDNLDYSYDHVCNPMKGV